MANRSTHPLSCAKPDTQMLSGQLTGGGVGLSLVVAGVNTAASDIVSATWTATGKYSVVFRYSYPELRSAMAPAFNGTTDGLVGQWNGFDPVAKTAALEVYVGNTATDLALTDTVYLNWVVRNSGKNG